MIRLIKLGFAIVLVSLLNSMDCKAQSNPGKKDTTGKEDKSVKKLDSTNAKTPVIRLEGNNDRMPNALDKEKKDTVGKEKKKEE
jgi:hypothetical protein